MRGYGHRNAIEKDVEPFAELERLGQISDMEVGFPRDPYAFKRRAPNVLVPEYGDRLIGGMRNAECGMRNGHGVSGDG